MAQQNPRMKPGAAHNPWPSSQNNGASEGMGMLPASAPLANPYVPFQRTGSAQYEPGMAMVRGTLYPGLELPFMGMVNNDPKDSPLAQLMAMNFVLVELTEYLDTHSEDQEALEMFKKYARMYQDSREAYEENYGPLILTHAGGEKTFSWIRDPWPWDYDQKVGDE